MLKQKTGKSHHNPTSNSAPPSDIQTQTCGFLHTCNVLLYALMKISKVIEMLASFSIKVFGWNIGYNSQLTLISYATNIQQANDAPSAEQTLQAEQMRT